MVEAAGYVGSIHEARTVCVLRDGAVIAVAAGLVFRVAERVGA